MPEKLLNLKQVQDALGISESTIFRLMKNKKLKGFKIGREWRFQEKDIDALIARQRQEVEQSTEDDPTGQLVIAN